MDPHTPITIINESSALGSILPALTGVAGAAVGGWIASRVSKSAALRQWTADSYEHTRKYFSELLIATDSLRIHLSNVVSKYEKVRAEAVKASAAAEGQNERKRVDFRVEQTAEELLRSRETLTEFRKVLSRVGLYGGRDIHDKISAVDATREALVEELNNGLIDAARRELEIFDIEVQILRRGTQKDVALHSLLVLNTIAPRRGRKQQREQALTTIAEIDRLDTEDRQKLKVLRAKPNDTSPIMIGSFAVERMQ